VDDKREIKLLGQKALIRTLKSQQRSLVDLEKDGEGGNVCAYLRLVDEGRLSYLTPQLWDVVIMLQQITYDELTLGNVSNSMYGPGLEKLLKEVAAPWEKLFPSAPTSKEEKDIRWAC
jgi:hypothetical protein